MTKNARAPQAFIIDNAETPTKKTHRKNPLIEFTQDAPVQELVVAPNQMRAPSERGIRWGFILISAVFTLLSLWTVLTITQTIEGYFARSPFLGWIAFAIGCIAALATAVILIKEVWGLMRLRRIEKLQQLATHAINHDDEISARKAIASLLDLYKKQSHQAWNIKNYNTHAQDILDPRDRIRLAERLLVDPLDETAHAIIAKRARKVTLLTTVTPAAILDVLFVGAQNIAMLREIATLYGGRPSTFATLRLARMVVTHLAIAGGLAISENLLHVFVGKGLLGRLSARFGEGALNGILTSRIGLAACEVCRPIPKEESKREKLGSLIKELANFNTKTTSGN